MVAKTSDNIERYLIIHIFPTAELAHVDMVFVDGVFRLPYVIDGRRRCRNDLRDLNRQPITFKHRKERKVCIEEDVQVAGLQGVEP